MQKEAFYHRKRVLRIFRIFKYMIFTIERFSKVAIERWTVLDFHPGLLNLVQTL